jgi:hypothetical protein
MSGMVPLFRQHSMDRTILISAQTVEIIDFYLNKLHSKDMNYED